MTKKTKVYQFQAKGYNYPTISSRKIYLYYPDNNCKNDFIESVKHLFAMDSNFPINVEVIELELINNWTYKEVKL